MENNIFKGAKFGDKFLCKNGRVAIYISPADSYENESIRAYSLTIQYQGNFDVLEDGRLVNSDGTYGNDEFDIISSIEEDDDNILECFPKIWSVSGKIYELNVHWYNYQVRVGYTDIKNANCSLAEPSGHGQTLNEAIYNFINSIKLTENKKI